MHKGGGDVRVGIGLGQVMVLIVNIFPLFPYMRVIKCIMIGE